jgi:hypothetical protein
MFYTAPPITAKLASQFAAVERRRTEPRPLGAAWWRAESEELPPAAGDALECRHPLKTRRPTYSVVVAIFSKSGHLRLSLPLVSAIPWSSLPPLYLAPLTRASRLPNASDWNHQCCPPPELRPPPVSGRSRPSPTPVSTTPRSPSSPLFVPSLGWAGDRTGHWRLQHQKPPFASGWRKEKTYCFASRPLGFPVILSWILVSCMFAGKPPESIRCSQTSATRGSFSDPTLAIDLFTSTIGCVLWIFSISTSVFYLIASRSFQSCFTHIFYVSAPFQSVQVVLGS